jgi:hypothetical protein
MTAELAYPGIPIVNAFARFRLDRSSADDGTAELGVAESLTS